MKIISKILIIQIATFALLSCDNDKKLDEIKIPEIRGRKEAPARLLDLLKTSLLNKMKM